MECNFGISQVENMHTAEINRQQKELKRCSGRAEPPHGLPRTFTDCPEKDTTPTDFHAANPEVILRPSVIPAKKKKKELCHLIFRTLNFLVVD